MVEPGLATVVTATGTHRLRLAKGRAAEDFWRVVESQFEALKEPGAGARLAAMVPGPHIPPTSAADS